MNLQDYIERMKMWIDKQHFIMRHYKFALGIFLIITVALLGIGIFYPIHAPLYGHQCGLYQQVIRLSQTGKP